MPRAARAGIGKLAGWLAGACFAAALAASAMAEPPYTAVTNDHPIEFPRDFGSHPSFRTEWWYATGWLSPRGSAGSGEPLGFQVTFFRSRPAIDAANPSAFTPHQLLIAHCALSDPQRGRLWQDQKIRRAGMGLARAAEGDTDIQVESWTLRRTDAVYAVNVTAEEFALRLELAPTQAPLLNGERGVSRKGAAPQAASYYYSLPHLAVRGTIVRNGRREAVQGEAWLDHSRFAARAMRRSGPGARSGVPTARPRFSHPARCASCRGAAGSRRAPAPRTRSNGTCKRERASSISNR
jgi:predicted secreted hydrolase